LPPFKKVETFQEKMEQGTITGKYFKKNNMPSNNIIVPLEWRKKIGG
jgi:hypothetical protein